jgi:hypothetical protein
MIVPFLPLALFFAFSAFAFGCMEGWAIAACEVILFAGAAAAGWRDPEFWRLPRRLWLPALFVTLLVVVGALQLVPLPAPLWRAAGAERVAVYDEGARAEALLRSDAYRRDPLSPETRPLPPDAAPALTPEAPAWIPASFTPKATAQGIIALLAGLCLILLLERLAERGKNLKPLLLTVGLLGLAVAAAALVVHGQAPTRVLGLRASAFADRAFGPFVNANHGEAFVNLALPCLYYLLWRKSLRAHRRSEKWGLRLLILGIFCFHLVLLAVSHSRGAYLALALYPLALLGRWAFRGSRLAAAASVLYGLALAVSVLFVLGNGMIFESGRVELNANVPARHWLLGQGLASFEERFPAVVTDFPLAYTTKYNTHLEDEYLQTFFEAGLVPALLLAAAGLYAILLALRAVRFGHASFWFAPALAGETIHASVDFTGHVFPVVGAYLLLWLMVSRVQLQEEGAETHGGRSGHHATHARGVRSGGPRLAQPVPRA